MPTSNTRVEAYSLLVAVRAGLGNVPGLQNKIMIVGQAQGGGATVASAAFSATYAPELSIRGTVATGSPYITPKLMQQVIAAPALAAMKYQTLKLSQPLFICAEELDRDVPPALQHGLIKAACAAGTIVQAHVYKGLNRDQTVNASFSDSAAFTKTVMDGQPVTPECNPTPE